MTSLAIVRKALGPALLLFLLPLFGWWFADHAVSSYDELITGNLLQSVETAENLAPAERDPLRQFLAAHPPSEACASDSAETAPLRHSIREACSDFDQFEAMRLLSLFCLGLGLFGFAAAALTALVAHLSRRLQVAAFGTGWNLLRVVGAIEVAGQGALATFLSFWITALWLDFYVPKLVFLIGFLALGAVWAVLQAIFRRTPQGLTLTGEILEPSRAEELWERLRSLSAALGTTPPDHVVVGIDDNFFVTEAEVRVGKRLLRGRTLYLSLALLRVLDRYEAEAVFAHEMAHLRGGDTARSRMLAPMMNRFAQYLGALHENLLARPVFFFLEAWFVVFELAVARDRRQRELDADAAAARLVSPMGVARSLLKVAAYSSYRARVEDTLLGADALHAELGIARRVAVGFSDYARNGEVNADLAEAVTPHPFDSHPPMRERLAHVGVELPQERWAEILTEPVTASWAEAIPEAAEIEARLWEAYESTFSAFHEISLTYRYLPSTDEERALVEKYFPPVTIARKDGNGALRIDFEKIQGPEWPEPIYFHEIVEAQIQERLMSRHLELGLRERKAWARKPSVCLSNLEVPLEEARQTFESYWARSQSARQYQEERRLAG